MTFKRSFSSTVLVASVAGALALGFALGKSGANPSFSSKPPQVETQLKIATCATDLKSETGRNIFLTNQLNERDARVKELNATIDGNAKKCNDAIDQTNTLWKTQVNKIMAVAQQAQDNSIECQKEVVKCSNLVDECKKLLDRMSEAETK